MFISVDNKLINLKSINEIGFTELEGINNTVLFALTINGIPVSRNLTRTEKTKLFKSIKTAIKEDERLFDVDSTLDLMDIDDRWKRPNGTVRIDWPE